MLDLQVAPTSTAIYAIGQPGRLHHAMNVWLPYTNCGIATYPNRAIGMAGLSPARLRPCRPLHQTPVVTRTLAISHPGLLPSAALQSVGFHPELAEFIPMDHNYTFFGAQYRACNLAPSSFGLPLPVLPVDFANELLAKLCSCGTSADHATQLRSKLRTEIYCLIHSPKSQGKPCRKVHSFSLCAVTHWVTISNFIHR